MFDVCLYVFICVWVCKCVCIYICVCVFVCVCMCAYMCDVFMYVCFCVYVEGRKEGNVLFNDELNTFYLQLYGIRHKVKDHSDSESGKLLPPHRLIFPISSKGSFICTIPQTGYHIPRPLLHQSWSTSYLALATSDVFKIMAGV